MRLSSRPALVLAGFALMALLVLILARGFRTQASAPEVVAGEPEARSLAGPASGEVELHDIKFEQLVKRIRGLRGHIVVMDVWGTFCVPCKREFPGLVRMHQQHARDGVVCLSISVDEKDKRPEALEFLRSRKATLWNYYMDEDSSVWEKGWCTDQVPLVMVFDRTGQRAARFPVEKDKPFTYADVEKVVAELLAGPR